MSLVYRIGFSANKRALIDRAIIDISRRYDPTDLDMLAPGEDPSNHCWRQFHERGTLIDYNVIVEAVPPATREGTFAEKFGQVVRLYEVPVDALHAAHALAIARAQVGEPYSFVAVLATYGLLRFGLHDVWEGLETARLDCSQADTQDLRAIGIDACPGTSAANVIPWSLEAWIRRQGWRRVDTSLHAAIA